MKSSPFIESKINARCVYILFFILFLNSYSIASQGITYYVSTKGLDSNTGSLNAPFKTIEYGVTHLNPGDELAIFGGVYLENQIDIIPSGTEENHIIIRAYDSDDKPIIRSTSPSGSELDFIFEFSGKIPASTSTGYTHGDQSYITLKDLILDGYEGGPSEGNCNNWGLIYIGEQSRDGNNTSYAHHITVKDSELMNTSRLAVLIRAKSHNNLFENISVHDIRLNQTCVNYIEQGGFYTGGWKESHMLAFYIPGSANTIRGSKLYDIDNVGVSFYNPDPTGYPSSQKGPNLIEKNTFHDISNKGIIVNKIDSDPVYGERIVNNVFYNNTTNPDRFSNIAIYLRDGASNTLMYNNTFYNSYQTIYFEASAGSRNQIINNIFDKGPRTYSEGIRDANPDTKSSTSIIESNLFSGIASVYIRPNPNGGSFFLGPPSGNYSDTSSKFEDELNYNFNLLEKSLAIDNGSSLPFNIVTDDFNGTPRSPDECDIGAFERDAANSDSVLSTTTLNESLDVSLYPNPFENELRINNAENSIIVQSIDFYSTTGALLYSHKNTTYNSVETIETSQLKTGMYFVKIKTDDGKTATFKMLKK